MVIVEGCREGEAAAVTTPAKLARESALKNSIVVAWYVKVDYCCSGFNLGITAYMMQAYRNFTGGRVPGEKCMERCLEILARESMEKLGVFRCHMSIVRRRRLTFRD